MARPITWQPLIDFDYLMSMLPEWRSAFANAEPYPHLVIDNFIDLALVRALVDEIPNYRELKNSKDAWETLDSGKAAQFKKDFLSMELRAGRLTRQMYWELNSAEFIVFLQQLTGIAGLLPDPYLLGGGIHETRRDGYLVLHADFNKQKETGLDRRLNIIVYLNETWPADYGGALQLWERDQSRCVKTVEPVAGRAVLFATEPDTWHGHPEPLRCPEEESRKSLALYYYSRTRDGVEVPAEKTLWFDSAADQR